MNSVSLVGRLTRDPDVRYTPSQLAVARFTVAVDRQFSKDSDQTADFISCVAFGKTAEFIERYFPKGKLIGLTGRIQTGSYTNKDGVKVYTTDVVAERVEFVGSKSENSGSFAPKRPGGDSDTGFSGSNDFGGGSNRNTETDFPGGFSALDDEDLPF